MLTHHTSSRLWIAGLVCLVAGSASAQERTAEFSAQDAARQAQQSQIQQVIHFYPQYRTRVGYCNPWANYAPGYNTYPIARDPARGYVAYGYTGGSCCNGWWHNHCCAWKNNCAAGCANFGHRFRCSMAWLKPLTYWDVGAQCDIIALNPGYVNPADMNPAYAAQGYGVPVSVPQAPNVRANYNYSWGLPSSRLTSTNFPAAPY